MSDAILKRNYIVHLRNRVCFLRHRECFQRDASVSETKKLTIKIAQEGVNNKGKEIQIQGKHTKRQTIMISIFFEDIIY